MRIVLLLLLLLLFIYFVCSSYLKDDTTSLLKMTRDDLEKFETQVRQSGDRVTTLATPIM